MGGAPVCSAPGVGADVLLSLQQAVHTQEALEEAAQMMKEAVEDLTATLNEAASAAGVVGGMVDSITQAINQVRGGVGRGGYAILHSLPELAGWSPSAAVGGETCCS